MEQMAYIAAADRSTRPGKNVIRADDTDSHRFSDVPEVQSFICENLRNLWIDRFSIVGPRHPAPETDPAPSHPSVPIRGTSVALQFYYSLAANPVLAAHLQERLFPALSITYVSGIAQAPTAGSWCRAGIAKLPRVPDRSTTCHQKGRTRGSSAEFTASHRFLWYLSAFILHLRESA